jgi:RecQ family ATP-dependent DNA helicase
LQNTTHSAHTQKRAISNSTTYNAVLDFFSKSGALRGRTGEVLNYFQKAFSEDETLALRALFYMRDVRGGQGERESFKVIIQWLAKNHKEAILCNLIHILVFGRYDDFYALVRIPEVSNDVFQIMKEQFEDDLAAAKEGDNVSLLGKWLKSENTSSKESRKLGKLTRKFFGLESEEYRKSLVLLRNKINIIETLVTQKKWNDIPYEHVPSHAMKLYTKTFTKNDKERFVKYLEDVKAGKKTIKASTLYPYDIVHELLDRHVDGTTLSSLQAQWEALPDFLEGSTEKNGIVVADVSGSMTGRPMEVAISLALYFAERNTGTFKDYFLTFSETPELVKVYGNDLKEKIKNISRANWGNSTKIQLIFDLILDAAVKNNTKEEDMPSKVFIVSDMQFDIAVKDNNKTNFEVIEEKYKAAGYKRPVLVFWNVNASSDSPVTKDENGTFLVSGCSPSILKYAMNTVAVTPLELMLEVLNSERYSKIKSSGTKQEAEQEPEEKTEAAEPVKDQEEEQAEQERANKMKSIDEIQDIIDSTNKKIKEAVREGKTEELEQLKAERKELFEKLDKLEMEIASLPKPQKKAEIIVPPKNEEIPPQNKAVENKEPEIKEEKTTTITPKVIPQKVYLFDEIKDDPSLTEEENAQRRAEWFDNNIEAKIKAANETTFKQESIDDVQKAAIISALRGNDVFVNLPQGGKSLIYMLPGYLEKGLTIVVSPLLSSNKAHVKQLNDMDILADKLDSETTRNEYIVATNLARDGKLRFLYLTPEKLMNGKTLNGLITDVYNKGGLRRFVIDEAHCISKLGHNFRTEYAQLSTLKEKFPNVPMMALTATANNEVKEDVLKVLNMKEYEVFSQSFNKPNLNYEVRSKDPSSSVNNTVIMEWIKQKNYQDAAGIIFCMKSKEAEKIAEFLDSNGFNASHYHARMKADARKKALDDWMEGTVKIICCTSAFGIGIEKPDVRFVIHQTMPRSLEAYYQESGNAGRDGEKSDCLLLFAASDSKIGVDKEGEKKEVEEKHINAVIDYAQDNQECRRKKLLAYFDESIEADDCHDMCDNCRKRGVAEKPEEVNDPMAKAIFESLVDLRKQVAAQQSIEPEELISTDNVNDIAKRRPLNKDEMMKINHMSEEVFDSFGNPALQRIAKIIESQKNAESN